MRCSKLQIIEDQPLVITSSVVDRARDIIPREECSNNRIAVKDMQMKRE
jgi:hypothetical protein